MSGGYRYGPSQITTLAAGLMASALHPAAKLERKSSPSPARRPARRYRLTAAPAAKPPTNGGGERARRLRQIAKGMIRVHEGEGKVAKDGLTSEVTIHDDEPFGS